MLSKFAKLNDFLRIKFDLVHAKTSVKLLDQNELMRQKYREEHETFQLYQILLARDKELHQLLLDIYEMKCIALTYLGDAFPPRPLYKALPATNIRCPQPFPDMRIIQENSSQDDDRLFRNVITPVTSRELDTPTKNSDSILSGSWEDLPGLCNGDGVYINGIE